ncbi:unnamed protein product [Lasius platythorax]|uniref:Uncharacterized protein n=1 Tax=Lasius platythorax TaxID=488582 RepID=A0AAV2NXB2_9HYME
MPTDGGNTSAGTGRGMVSNPATESGTVQAPVSISNPFNVDPFDPRQETLKRWLQRLEGAFQVFRICEDSERVAYLLHLLA